MRPSGINPMRPSVKSSSFRNDSSRNVIYINMIEDSIEDFLRKISRKRYFSSIGNIRQIFTVNTFKEFFGIRTFKEKKKGVFFSMKTSNNLFGQYNSKWLPSLILDLQREAFSYKIPQNLDIVHKETPKMKLSSIKDLK